MIAIWFIVACFLGLLIGALLVLGFLSEDKTPCRPRVEYSLTAKELQNAIDVAARYAEKYDNTIRPSRWCRHLNCLLMIQRARAKEIELSLEKREYDHDTRRILEQAGC